MFALDDRRFQPLWIRVLITRISVDWGIFELITGSVG